MEYKLEFRQLGGEGTTGGLSVSLNYKSNRYHTILSTDEDYNNCQRPEPFFTPKFCAKYIVNNSYSVEYDNTNDLFEITYTPNTTESIVLVLHCLPRQTPTIEELVRRIEELEDRTPLKTLATLTYPEWSTYEEFKRLDGFKYIEACNNFNSYIKQIPESINKLYLYKIDGVYVNLKFLTRPLAASHGIYGEINNYAGALTSSDTKLHNIDQDLIAQLQRTYETKKSSLSLHEKYIRSGRKACFITNQLPSYIMAYFTEYFYGWLLLNLDVLYRIQYFAIEIHTYTTTTAIKVNIKIGSQKSTAAPKINYHDEGFYYCDNPCHIGTSYYVDGIYRV